MGGGHVFPDIPVEPWAFVLPSRKAVLSGLWLIPSGNDFHSLGARAWLGETWVFAVLVDTVVRALCLHI